MAAFYKTKRHRSAAAKKKKRLAVRICRTAKCGRPALKQRHYCNKCRTRMYHDPFRRLYWNLRKSARERAKTFSLTWEYFRELALRTGYNVLHGRKPHHLQMDRIDPRKGYEPGNVQVLTTAEHRRKTAAERRGWLPEMGPY